MVWKGYHNAIPFSIISNFYISKYPVYYWSRNAQIRLYIYI